MLRWKPSCSDDCLGFDLAHAASRACGQFECDPGLEYDSELAGLLGVRLVRAVQ
jgi:hypothetical protein